MKLHGLIACQHMLYAQGSLLCESPVCSSLNTKQGMYVQQKGSDTKLAPWYRHKIIKTAKDTHCEGRKDATFMQLLQRPMLQFPARYMHTLV